MVSSFIPQVSTVLGAALPDQRAKNEWIEGVAIWVAVLLVTCVGTLCICGSFLIAQQLSSPELTCKSQCCYAAWVNPQDLHAFSGAGNDWNKDKQFRKLNSQKDEIRVKVIRAGIQILVLNTDIVVGDVLILDTGDKVCVRVSLHQHQKTAEHTEDPASWPCEAPSCNNRLKAIAG
jgi:Ca2+-transporting ATPase